MTDTDPTDSTDHAELAARCQREVEELHAFFMQWFLGHADEAEDDSRFTSVLDESFVIVHPDGHVNDHEGIVTGVRAAHGSMRDRTFVIEVRNLRVHHVVDGMAVVTYEEHQQRDDKHTARLSTAVFRHAPDAPNGLCWLHVHETWLPDEG